MVRARRAGEPATSTAVDGVGDRAARLASSCSAWGAQQGADGGRVRPGSRCVAGAGGDEDLAQSERAEDGGMDLQDDRRGRDGTVPCEAGAKGFFLSEERAEPARRHYARAACDGCGDRRARSAGRVSATWKSHRADALPARGAGGNCGEVRRAQACAECAAGKAGCPGNAGRRPTTEGSRGRSHAVEEAAEGREGAGAAARSGERTTSVLRIINVSE